MDLSAARGALSRAAAAARRARRDAPDRSRALFAEAQAAKTFVNERPAASSTARSPSSGGAGYMNGHPLARAYRDVRAGAFMHPLGANRAYDLVGRVALGADPAIH